MRKAFLIIFAIIICIVSVGAERKEVPPDNSIHFEEQGFVKMHTTAYCMGHTTANGSKVHTGGCAVNYEHMGQIAEIYTLDGNFLGLYEVNDVGGTQGLQDGRVIDVYRNNLTQCEMYMKITGGKVWVRFTDGNG